MSGDVALLGPHGLHGLVGRAEQASGWRVGPTLLGSKSVSAQDGSAQGVAFSADGTRMYIAGATNATVYQYTLSSAWDVTTASSAASKAVSAQDTFPADLAFSPDGTRMYIAGSTNSAIYQYTLSTAWDVTTAAAAGSKSVTSQSTVPVGVAFTADGTRMFALLLTNDTVYQYNLSTAWDVTTATVGGSKSVTSQDTNPASLAFSRDGTRMFVLGTTGDNVYQYDLSTAWDVTTATSTARTSVASQDGTAQGLAFSRDGTRMYVAGTTSDNVYQYDLG